MDVEAGAFPEVLEATSLALLTLLWADTRATRPKVAMAVKKRILRLLRSKVYVFGKLLNERLEQSLLSLNERWKRT